MQTYNLKSVETNGVDVHKDVGIDYILCFFSV